MPEINAPNLYTRWSHVNGSNRVTADILGTFCEITYDADAGRVSVTVAADTADATPADVDPDTARMIGVRLIEAATRAEAERRVRGRRRTDP